MTAADGMPLTGTCRSIKTKQQNNTPPPQKKKKKKKKHHKKQIISSNIYLTLFSEQYILHC